MPGPIKIILAGAAGRMGSMIMRAILDADGLELAAAFERPDHPDLGQDAGVVAGLSSTGFNLAGGLDEVLAAGDVLIDFTEASASLDHAEKIAAAGKAAVIGSTGLNPDQQARLAELGRTARIVFAPNMSVGVNLLFKVVGDVARILGPGFDIEIIEAHHRLKKDAPSGTAVRLADILAEAVGRSMEECGVYGRQGLVGERTQEEIGVLAVRAGDIVGEHTVLFGGVGERIEITHKAHSRDTFARGAVRAAAWLYEQPPGLYDMQDVLGLR